MSSVRCFPHFLLLRDNDCPLPVCGFRVHLKVSFSSLSNLLEFVGWDFIQIPDVRSNDLHEFLDVYIA